MLKILDVIIKILSALTVAGILLALGRDIGRHEGSKHSIYEVARIMQKASMSKDSIATLQVIADADTTYYKIQLLK